jgi:hypothetical protein
MPVLDLAGEVLRAAQGCDPLSCSVKRGKHDLREPHCCLPIEHCPSERQRQGAMTPEEDAGAGFRLTRSAAHDRRSADFDDTELGGGDIVAIETGSRPHPPTGVWRRSEVLISERTKAKRNRSFNRLSLTARLETFR